MCVKNFLFVKVLFFEVLYFLIQSDFQKHIVSLYLKLIICYSCNNSPYEANVSVNGVNTSTHVWLNLVDRQDPHFTTVAQLNAGAPADGECVVIFVCYTYICMLTIVYACIACTSVWNTHFAHILVLLCTALVPYVCPLLSQSPRVTYTPHTPQV